VFVVLHTQPQGPGLLPDILSRSGPLPACHPEDGDPIRPGEIYVAPPDHHLLIDGDRVRVTRGPKENRHRPAVDPLFRSAALHYGPQVVGVVLSGALDDGTAGLQAIKQRGGVTVVQDPLEALYPSMPQSAMNNVALDYCLPVAEIPPLLARLARESAADPVDYPVPPRLQLEAQMADYQPAPLAQESVPGIPSVYACPECHGVLWEIEDGSLLRFRCRVGHAYTADSMMAVHAESLEDSLWIALRALEESASLARRMAENSRAHNRVQMAAQYQAKATEREYHAHQIRAVLEHSGGNAAVKTTT
jgi:two-component system chemotaxis response regulator CheB